MADRERDIRLFERAAKQRLEAALFLFNHGFNLDAVYLAGYVVECALKALILKWTPRNDFRAVLAKLTEAGARGHDFVYLKDLLKERRGKRGAKDKGVFDTLAENLRIVDTWSTALRYQVGVLKKKHAAHFLKATEAIQDWCLRG